MEWRHSGLPRPTKFRVQKSAVNVLASMFWDQDGILLIHYLPKGQISTRSVTYLCWRNWRTFWRKNAGRGKVTKGIFFLHDNAPGSPGTCNPEETGLPGLPLSWSPTLFSGSGPVGLPPVLWTEKNNWKVAIFRPTRRSLLAAETWLDGQPSNFFFLVACRSYSNGLRSVWSFVEIMLNKSRIWSL